jgi:DNA-directed RNA polymerase subunit M/transcription elongation factor TFIIS
VRVARGIEEGCYRAVAEGGAAWEDEAFQQRYATRCGEVARTLDPRGAVAEAYGRPIFAALSAKKIAPEHVGGMSCRALCPPAFAEAERRLELHYAAIESSKAEVVASSLYRCPHCGARRCTFRSVQRRSGDEAANTECTCLECGMGFRGD